MTGIPGFGQRLLDRGVYDKHVPLDRDALAAAHRACGFAVLRSEYLMSVNLAVINHPNLRPAFLNKLARGLLVSVTGALWALERVGLHLPRSRVLSPYVACVAKKPA
jgi:hypothetical protein